MPKNAEKNTTTLSRIENKSTLKHVMLAASQSFILIVLIYRYIWSGVRSQSSNLVILCRAAMKHNEIVQLCNSQYLWNLDNNSLTTLCPEEM